MTAPNVIWTASTNGKCHVGFDTPSANYTNRYIRADAPELVALVDAASALERNLGMKGVSVGSLRVNLSAALAAWEALK